MRKKILSLILLSASFNPSTAQDYKWSWLDSDSKVTPLSTTIDKSIKPYRASIGAALYSFDSTSMLTAETPLTAGKNRIGGGLWSCDVQVAPTKERGVMDITLKVKLDSGAVNSTAVALVVDMEGWSADNYVLLPAAAYNGNRFPMLDVGYPGFFNDKGNAPGQAPWMTNISRLALGYTPDAEVAARADNRTTFGGVPTTTRAKMENAATDLTTPMIGLYAPSLKRSLMLFTDVETELGTSGLFVDEDLASSRARLVVSAPTMREYNTAYATQVASSDRAPDWTAGKSATLRFKLVTPESKDLQSFYAQFLKYRKVMSGPSQLRNITPYSKAFEIQHAYQNSEDRWNEQGGYYKNGNGDSPFGHIQIGWVGGLMQTYPLLMRGDGLTRERVARTIDTVCHNMQGEAGFFYGVYRNGVLYGDGFDSMSEKPRLAMVRKNADALYFLIKQLMLLDSFEADKADDRSAWASSEKMKASRTLWLASTRRLADAFVALWEREGEFGQVVDVTTGGLYAYGSSAAGLAPGALALAARYFDDPRYMKVAEAAATQYLERDVLKGYTTGGPGEILQCPDSESAFAVLESFVVLYELTGDRRWLDASEAMAPIAASWVMSYDYDFPTESSLGRVKARSTGSVWASIQNRHSAPGMCSTSGDMLLKLYRATGNVLYLDLLQDVAHNILEFMTTPTHVISCPRDGFVNERVNISDWEGKGNVGAVICSSVSWCELAIMLTTTEIPGIYAVPDRGIIRCFDHIEAAIVSNSSDGMVVKLHNPTPYDAVATILSEGSKRMSTPLGWSIFRNLPDVSIPAGKSVTCRLENNGSVVLL